MIPLSNGRSPRIDQFYATLRTYKSHQFTEDLHNRSDEEKSIQHIRSLGKQILQDPVSPSLAKGKPAKMKQELKNLNRSAQSLFKASNLYDKYKMQVGRKIGGQVNRAKEVMAGQEQDRNYQKVKGDRKYDQIPSKIGSQGNSSKLHGLNYAKKTQKQAQKLKKQQDDLKKVQKEIKQKQNYFQRSGKLTKSYKQGILSGVLKRADELQARKQRCVEQLRNEQLEKTMREVTFQPQMVSKRINTIEPNFQKRASMAQTKRLSNQKSLIFEAVNSHSFNPQLNLYRNTDSKIGKIWKEEKTRVGRGHDRKMEAQEQFNQLAYKSQQQTANSTLQINLKSMNEISFIFE